MQQRDEEYKNNSIFCKELDEELDKFKNNSLVSMMIPAKKKHF